MKYTVKRSHRAIREQQYPPVGDQLDAIWKVIGVLNSQGIDIGEDARGILARIAEIKDGTPKLVGSIGFHPDAPE